MWPASTQASSDVPLSPQHQVVVGAGWHNLYELKVDPENADNMIICGSRWDVAKNALLGFVYVSIDGGKDWRPALEDRHSTWVSEESCAFGAGHRAYFLCGASKVVDGNAHHNLGQTRLYVSSDAGRHWAETLTTGWVDFSASIFAPAHQSLLTFYNDEDTFDLGRNLGGVVGALEFSPDGKKVSGPFYDRSMPLRNYHGILPFRTTTLRDGSVVALYYGARQTAQGRTTDLGLVRVEDSPSLTVKAAPIATLGRCATFDGNALAYNGRTSQLYVAYGDEAEGSCQLFLAVSSDGGINWTRNVIHGVPNSNGQTPRHVDLAILPGGSLGMLSEVSGQWYFSEIRQSSIITPPIALSSPEHDFGVENDSLSSVVYQANGPRPDPESNPVIELNMRATPDEILRASGLCATDKGVIAIFPVLGDEGETLRAVVLNRDNKTSQALVRQSSDDDVTREVVLLFGRAQHFDNATGKLSVELRIGNRGGRAIGVPIRLEVTGVSSEVGDVKILNADNDKSGVGAVWDISHAVTGDRIPPGATEYNTFQLSFHIDRKTKQISTEHLLNLKVRVHASRSSNH